MTGNNVFMQQSRPGSMHRLRLIIKLEVVTAQAPHKERSELCGMTFLEVPHAHRNFM
jgi:hypothetical protein